MNPSSLQLARYQYQPKLPGMLRNGIAEISVRDGGATQSVFCPLIYPLHLLSQEMICCCVPYSAV